MHARRFAFYVHFLDFVFEIGVDRGSPLVGSAGARARWQPLCHRSELGQLVGGLDRNFLTEREITTCTTV
jgi:hypothetical protein